MWLLLLKVTQTKCAVHQNDITISCCVLWALHTSWKTLHWKSCVHGEWSGELIMRNCDHIFLNVKLISVLTLSMLFRSSKGGWFHEKEKKMDLRQVWRFFINLKISKNTSKMQRFSNGNGKFLPLKNVSVSSSGTKGINFQEKFFTFCNL